MDLRVIVRHYKEKHRPRARAELDSFRAEPSLAAAVRRAGRAEFSTGKRDPHHRRRSQSVLDRAADRLIERLPAIEAATNFARLLEAVMNAVGHFEGLGKLYLYDTTLRIGAKKGTLPTRIYLHAGTREGAGKLGIDIKGRKVLDRSDLPSALQELEPHEIEDVLCIYKNLFDADADEIEDAATCWPETDDDPADDDGIDDDEPAPTTTG